MRGNVAHIPSRFIAACTVTPPTITSLLLPFAPVRMLILDRGTSSASDRKSTTASLALPSTGGAQSRNFSASPTIPPTSLRDARGTTLNAIATPSPDAVIQFMHAVYSPEASRSSERIRRWRIRNDRQCQPDTALARSGTKLQIVPETH